MSEFELDLLPNRWVHPATGCTILGEDMPWELVPEDKPTIRYSSFSEAISSYGLRVESRVGEDDE